jgi:hypothetical protein
VELKLNSVLTEPEVGPVMETVRGVDEMLIKWNAEAVLPLWSVTVRVTLYVPFTAKLVENVDAVPLAGLPPVTAHAYVYGAVPPLTVDEKLTIVLIVPEVGPVMLADNADGVMVTSTKAVAVFPLWSVTVNVTLYVPFTANEVVNEAEVPEAGLPPVTAHM